jgi:hypothetical protein
MVDSVHAEEARGAVEREQRRMRGERAAAVVTFLAGMVGLWLERRSMRAVGKAGIATLEVRPTGRKTLQGRVPQPSNAMVAMKRAQVNDVANMSFGN